MLQLYSHTIHFYKMDTNVRRPAVKASMNYEAVARGYMSSLSIVSHLLLKRTEHRLLCHKLTTGIAHLCPNFAEIVRIHRIFYVQFAVVRVVRCSD